MSSLLDPSKHGYPDSCDICEAEKPRWYCAADEAYLCDDCDVSVHGANSLALRHERVTLGYDESAQKVPLASPGRGEISENKHESSNASNASDSCCNWKVGSLQKPWKDRSVDDSLGANSSQNPFVKIGGITYTRATKVKLEPDSQLQDEHESYESSMGCNKWRESENCLSVHEVPVLVAVAQEMPSTTLMDLSRQACPSSLATPLEDASGCDFMGFLVPDDCEVDDYLISNTDLIGQDEEASIVMDEETITGDEKVEEKICYEFKSNESRLEFAFKNETQRSILYDYERYCDKSTSDLRLEYSELNVLRRSGKPKTHCAETFVPLAWVCEKLKVEISGETDQINQQLEAMIERPIQSISKEGHNKKSFLKLNYEDVLSAWSDRGCFWTDGQWPQTVPPDSTSQSLEEVNLDVGVVPHLSPESVKSLEQKEETHVLATTDGGREARVLRYREKRRTRLFSKKIRYEVRKLNAERRPRIKVSY
ncbi:hypothetical protein O6H91_16G043300 [Diphasiastrum complanatum]|uniref:Uncharacterized protein n=1 Tax=Diphasiastrum complanatum TaxID=34168 RepID=A0ACC2BBS1_DIPCM|nr:hypothetical protein O6H91_16G043300 [Diphasiastrum complanatum]